MNKVMVNPYSDNKGNSLSASLLKESTIGRETYFDVLQGQMGSITQNYFNDVVSIYRKALRKFGNEIDDLQLAILQQFEKEHCKIARLIDPDRIDFDITQAMDGEVCINRTATTGGKVKIIIHNDGLIAFSYLPYNLISEKEILTFQDYNSLDIEETLYAFFSF